MSEKAENNSLIFAFIMVAIVFGVPITVMCITRYQEHQKQLFCGAQGYEEKEYDDANFCYRINNGEIERYYFTDEDVKEWKCYDECMPEDANMSILCRSKCNYKGEGY